MSTPEGRGGKKERGEGAGGSQEAERKARKEVSDHMARGEAWRGGEEGRKEIREQEQVTDTGLGRD
jgi:hypothetical protein